MLSAAKRTKITRQAQRVLPSNSTKPPVPIRKVLIKRPEYSNTINISNQAVHTSPSISSLEEPCYVNVHVKPKPVGLPFEINQVPTISEQSGEPEAQVL